MMNMSAQLTSKLLLVEELLKKAAGMNKRDLIYD